MNADWTAPSSWTKISTVEAHTAGEPLRIVAGGLPPIPGKTMLDKRRYFQKHLDHLRRALILEPRGHADMYGCILTEAVTSDGTFGVLFLHNEGYSTMCGHGIIALSTVIIETGRIPFEGKETVLRIDTPAGRVTAIASVEKGRVTRVAFRNVPSFVFALDHKVSVPGLGNIEVDIAYGGAFYAFCRADRFGFDLVPAEAPQLIDLGRRIKQAVREAFPIRHPFEKELGFLYGTVFVGKPHDGIHHSRNVCVFAEGEVDRSPTGTGLSARSAIESARGNLRAGQAFEVESILGTCFTGRVADKIPYGPYEAVIPEISGPAHITGSSEWIIDPDDPLKNGFVLR